MHADGTGVISTQVLQEFASVALNRLHQRVDVVLAELSALESLEVVQLTPALIRRAVEYHSRTRSHYWDAAILAAAEAARCTRLWSEDFAPGSIYGLLQRRKPAGKVAGTLRVPCAVCRQPCMSCRFCA